VNALRLAVLAVVLGLAGCGTAGIADQPDATAASSRAPSPSPRASDRGSAPSPEGTAHGDTLTVDASIGYSGFAEWASGWSGVALVEVISVGPVRWTTETGRRPEEARLHSAPNGHEDAPGIGRVIGIRKVQVLKGSWTAASDIARYWRPGGRIAADETVVDLPLAEFAVGQQAVAFLLPQPDGLGDGGAIPVEVGWLFAVDDSGLVRTLDPNERVTLDRLPSLLE